MKWGEYSYGNRKFVLAVLAGGSGDDRGIVPRGREMVTANFLSDRSDRSDRSDNRELHGLADRPTLLWFYDPPFFFGFFEKNI